MFGLIPSGPAVPGPGRRRVSLLTEAMSYVGAILILAGGGAAIGQRWDRMTDWAHVGVFAGAALFFLMVGVFVQRVREPAVQRMIGVVWLLSAMGIAAATGLAAATVYDWSGPATTITIGLVTAAYAAILWRAHRGALQHVALFAALVVTLCGAVLVVGGESAPPLPFALTLWVFGIAWALVGWYRLAEPRWVAVPLGTALAVTSPGIAVADHGWMYAIAIVTAVAAMAVSVPARETVLLALGALATFGYVTATVVRYFGDSLGVPAALAITGVLIIVLTVISARLLRATRPARRTPSTARPPAAPSAASSAAEPPVPSSGSTPPASGPSDRTPPSDRTLTKTP